MTEELGLEKKKETINIDITGGLLPHTYYELMQFAALYKGSGLAPKSFVTTEQLAIAIGMCIELERPILTGIQDMAVINGRVSIYGDAALAIVRRSGYLEYIKETEEGQPYNDSWRFTCELKRKGSPVARIGVWTWEDAKRAGFDDPKMKDGGKDIYSPWRRFTRRMMQFKARNFPLRDEFGDVIKGMTLAEDAQDIIDVTPPTLAIEGRKDVVPGEKVYQINGGTKESPTGSTPANTPVFKCVHCDFETQSERGLKKHITNAHPQPPVEDLPVETGPPAQQQNPLEAVQTDPKEDEATKAFLSEAENYYKALDGTGEWPKILGVFRVATARNVKENMRDAFLRTCKSRLDKTLLEKES